MEKANAAQILSGFLFKAENQLPLNCITGSISKGFEVDNTKLIGYLIKFQEFIYKGQLPVLIEIEELWDRHSEYINDNSFSLGRVSGTTIMFKDDFEKAIQEFTEAFKATRPTP